jgi:hypothetical protein
VIREYGVNGPKRRVSECQTFDADVRALEELDERRPQELHLSASATRRLVDEVFVVFRESNFYRLYRPRLMDTFLVPDRDPPRISVAIDGSTAFEYDVAGVFGKDEGVHAKTDYPLPARKHGRVALNIGQKLQHGALFEFQRDVVEELDGTGEVDAKAYLEGPAARTLQ